MVRKRGRRPEVDCGGVFDRVNLDGASKRSTLTCNTVSTIYTLLIIGKRSLFLMFCFADTGFISSSHYSSECI